jgi:hypothetical protein
VLEALAAEVDAFVLPLEEAAALGPKARENRRAKLQAMQARVSEFARLLHTSAPDLLGRLEQLDFELVIDHLSATAANDTP